jgi:Na+-transporting methylmalonyl-CoA/oxaloacetate decarboxylase gamma subunit
MMFQVAKQKMRSLIHDEDGAVLAVTVIVFLILFLMAAAVYAIGETVRQRVELQNATDAAVYSAGVVEADSLSRIAAINQAMAWTHVKLNRMQMDYIVDKWLEKVVKDWDSKEDEMSTQFNYMGTCCWGVPYYSNGYMGVYRTVQLNGNFPPVPIDVIRAARIAAATQLKNHDILGGLIPIQKGLIKAMNLAEQDLISRIDDRMNTAVNETMKANLQESANDQAAGGGGINWCFLRENPKSNFKIFQQNNTEETKFLAHANYNDGPKSTYGRGTNVWWKEQGGEGLMRSYKQQGNSLKAYWNWYSTMWEITPDGPVLIDFIMWNSSTVKGEDVQDGHFNGERAKPNYLKKEYFAKGGSLVVGAKRRLHNPFYAFLGSDANGGIYRAFTVPASRSMWAASAAIAGYKPPNNSQKGIYEVTYTEPSIQKLWNLKQTDWDVVMIPLHRAKAQGTDGSWDHATGAEVLKKVAGQLGTGNEAAPKGTSSPGAAYDPGATEPQLRH